MKKQYRYPVFMLSGSNEDKKMVKELRDKYFVNISAFFREKIKELYTFYNSKENRNGT